MNDHTINTDATACNPNTPASGGYAYTAGTMIGSYRVIRPLGRGGMGEVYEVEHKVLRRRFALKFLGTDLLSQPGAMDRFQREAEVMANLNHPNIVKVDDFGEHQDRAWLRMELVGGAGVNPATGDPVVTLADVAELYGGRVPQDLLLGILQQVATGLAFAHGRGVVHRDLKPVNILLEGEQDAARAGKVWRGQAKIADFGLVKVAGEEWLRSRAEVSARRSMGSTGGARTAQPERTSEQALMGTYEYMSPEQRRCQDADARSDVYALGLLAFKLLTGRDPGTKPPSKIDPALWPAWDDLLIAALEFEPGDRPSDGAAFLARLQAVGPADQRPAPAHAVAPLPPPPPPPPPPRPQPPPPPRPSRPSPAREDPGHQPGETLIIDLGNGVGIDLVWIPPGEFMMGSPEGEVGHEDDEGPQHRVTISSGFWMGKYEVTQRQYMQLMGRNPSRFKGLFKSLELPVEQVSWDAAQEYCQALQRRLPRELAGKTARLPTEAEWEYACRAGTTTPFHYGDSLDSSMANFDAGSSKKTKPVGRFKPNAWGLYDMHGNVSEWCQDWCDDYAESVLTDPTGPNSGSGRVLRGGGWLSRAHGCRCARRDGRAPVYRNYGLGFRVVVS